MAVGVISELNGPTLNVVDRFLFLQMGIRLFKVLIFKCQASLDMAVIMAGY